MSPHIYVYTLVRSIAPICIVAKFAGNYIQYTASYIATYIIKLTHVP